MAEIQIEFDVRLRCVTAPCCADVYRPAGMWPWPVLLSQLPYGKQMPMVVAFLDRVRPGG